MRNIFGSEPINESQKLLKSIEKNFYPTFTSFRAKWSKKKYFFNRSEIFALLGNTLIANYEYSCTNRQNLELPTKSKLSEKASIFFWLFLLFLESTLTLQCSQRKRSLISQVFLKLLSSESPFAVNPLTSLKNSWNLQKSTIILLFNHS